MIPPLLHFTWVQGDRPFGYGEFLSVVSALRNTPYQVILHTNLTLQDASSNPYSPYQIIHDRYSVQCQEIQTTFHGVKARMANVSDILRIKILLQYGGIYSDLDILWAKPLPVHPPQEHVLITAYENPAYKIIANAMMAATPGYLPFNGLLEEFDAVFRALAAKGVSDLTADPRKEPYHTLLFKPTGQFLKKHATVIHGKSLFYKNGWRRIGRCLQRIGTHFKPSVSPATLGTTNDKLVFKDIIGFHYWSAFYDMEQLLELPDFREFAEPILETAATFLSQGENITYQ